MNKTICSAIIAGGLGILPGLNSISQGMDEGEWSFLNNPETVLKLERAWNSIETQKEKKALRPDEILATDYARAFLTEVNSVLKEDWREGEETFEDFVNRVPRFLPDEIKEEIKALSPLEARECIKEIKEAMYRSKFIIEHMILAQYENYEKNRQDFLDLLKNNSSDSPQASNVGDLVKTIDVKESGGLSYKEAKAIVDRDNSL